MGESLSRPGHLMIRLLRRGRTALGALRPCAVPYDDALCLYCFWRPPRASCKEGARGLGSRRFCTFLVHLFRVVGCDLCAGQLSVWGSHGSSALKRSAQHDLLWLPRAVCSVCTVYDSLHPLSAATT